MSEKYILLKYIISLISIQSVLLFQKGCYESELDLDPNYKSDLLRKNKLHDLRYHLCPYNSVCICTHQK